ncbi:MAG: TolC family protein [Calditrichaeota bacterium]|nr:TolC family protein [Calditrichota bacterium]
MRKLSLALVLFSLIISRPVEAQRRVTDLSGLVSLMLQRNPRLQAERREADASTRRAAAAGVLPNPSLSFGLKNVGWDRLTVGEEMMSGLDVSVSQKIPFPNKLKLSRAVAHVEASQHAQMAEETRLALVREAKELYAKLSYYRRSHELLKEKRALLEEGLRLAEARYTVGQGTQADLFKARVEISKTDELLLDVQAVLAELQARVAALLSLPPDSVEVETKALSVSTSRLEVSELLNRAQEVNPALKRLELEGQKAKANESLARASFLPDFMVQAGKMFRGRYEDVYEAMVGVEVPLYFWKRERNLLLEARLQEESAGLRIQDLRNQIAAALHENLVAARSAEARVALYRDKLIPQARQSLQATTSSYQVGRADFLSLLSDIESLIAYEMEYAKTLAELWMAVAKIEELTASEILGGE